MTFKGVITFTQKESHPDFMGDTKKKMRFSDTYVFADWYERHDAEAYIRNDLKLVAGGGYNVKHINNIKITIKKIS